MLNQPYQKPKGFSRQTLRFCGMLFLIAGMIGQAIIQNGILGLNQISVEQLMAALDNPDNMGFATIAILLMVIQSCAIPVFSFLLVEGFQHTSSLKNYMIRVAGLAVLTELPYNFATTGKVIDLSSRNPVFGMLLCLVVLYLYRHYGEKGFKNILIKALVTIMALLWVEMLDIADGAGCVIVVAGLWLLRNKSNFRVLGGCLAMLLASVFSPFYLVAPLAFLAIHFYNGEPGEENKVVNYLAYPALLLAVGLVAKLAF